MNIFQERERFKSELGHLTMLFAEMEFALLYIVGMIKNPANQQGEIVNHLGLSFEEKRKIIKEYIAKETPLIKDRWESINCKIGNINLDRRHLIHGIGLSYFFNKEIKTIIKKGAKVESKKYTVEDIKKIVNEIAEVLTGDDGLQGIFLNDFTTQILNAYNLNVAEDSKIVYQLNSVIMTDWKGKSCA